MGSYAKHFPIYIAQISMQELFADVAIKNKIPNCVQVTHAEMRKPIPMQS